MPNENEILNQETTDTTEDYISVINDMKKNTVSKDQYQKLREENQRLLKSLVDNEEIKVEKEVEKVDIDAIRQKIFNEDASLSDIDDRLGTIIVCAGALLWFDAILLFKVLRFGNITIGMIYERILTAAVSNEGRYNMVELIDKESLFIIFNFGAYIVFADILQFLPKDSVLGNLTVHTGLPLEEELVFAKLIIFVISI